MPRTRENRRAHRTRAFFDALSAVELAVVLILHALAKTLPETAKMFVHMLDFAMRRSEGMTPGARENLMRMRKIIDANNRKEGVH